MSSMSAVLAVDAETLTVTTIDPWNAVLAVAVAIVGWILSRVTRKAVGKLLTRLQGLSDELRDLTARASGYVVLFVGFGVALSIIGVPIQPLLTAVIVIGVILALALRGIAENFAAGIVLQTRRPIEVGDEVDSLDYVGDVIEMNGRAVVVETFDGRRVHLPNSQVLNNPLVNHTERTARRSEVEVPLRSRELEETVQDLAAIVAAVPGVMPEPAPAVYLTSVDRCGSQHSYSSGISRQTALRFAPRSFVRLQRRDRVGPTWRPLSLRHRPCRSLRLPGSDF